MKVTAVLYCAGRGSRLSAGVPKALVKIQGRTILQHLTSRILPITKNILVIAGFKAQLLVEHAGAIGVRCAVNESWWQGIAGTSQVAAMNTSPKDRILRLDGDLFLFEDIPHVKQNTIFTRTTGPTANYQTVLSADGYKVICPSGSYPIWTKAEFYEPGAFHKVTAEHTSGPFYEALSAAKIDAELRELSGLDINTKEDIQRVLSWKDNQ